MHLSTLVKRVFRVPDGVQEMEREREEKAAMNNSIILTMHIKCMSSGSGAQTNPACVHLNNVVKHKKMMQFALD